MADVNNEVVIIGRSSRGRNLRSKEAFNNALKSGNSVTVNKKVNAAQNKQVSASNATAKLDDDTEEFHHKNVTHTVSTVIRQQRMRLNMTQKELAQKVNEKHTIVIQYESGAAIPNSQILSKLQRILGIKLQGKDIGEPLKKANK